MRLKDVVRRVALSEDGRSVSYVYQLRVRTFKSADTKIYLHVPTGSVC